MKQSDVRGCSTEIEIANPREITEYSINLEQDYKKSSFTLQQTNSNFLIT